MTYRFVFFTTTIFLAATLAQAAPGAAQELRFAWPTDVVANIETEYTREATVDDAKTRLSGLRFSQQMQVRAHADGLSIQHTSPVYRESSGEVLKAVDALLASWVPTRIVSNEGDFLRAEGTAPLRGLVTEMLQKELADAPQILPAFEEFLKERMSESGLASLAKEHWRSLIRTWLGASLKPETKLTSDITQNLAPGIALPARTTLELIERVSCTRGEARECVTYQYTMRIDGNAWAGAMKSLGSSTPMRPQDYEMMIRVTLESATMLPHELVATQSQGTIVEANGRTVRAHHLERRTSRYTYQQP